MGVVELRYYITLCLAWQIIGLSCIFMYNKFCLLLLLCLGALRAYADFPDEIYQTVVPVASTSAMSRKDAFQQACKQILIKVSGDPHLPTNPMLSNACAQLQLVQEFRYIETDDPEQPFLLAVYFDSQAINNILAYAQKSLWQYRPALFAWIKINKLQQAKIIEQTTKNPISGLITMQAKRFGLPVLFPSLPRNNIQLTVADDVLNLDYHTLMKVIEQYHAEGVLLGNIDYTDTELKTSWQLLLGQKKWSWDINHSLPTDVVDELFTHIITVLRERDQAALMQSFATITMLVNGIEQQADLRQLLKILHQVKFLRAAAVNNISGNQVQLSINTNGDQAQLVSYLSGQEHLKLQGESENSLVYLWER